MPQRIISEANEWVYFLFTPSKNWDFNENTMDFVESIQDFEFYVNEEFGMVDIYVSQFNVDGDFQKNLPTETKNTWSFSQ